MTAAYNIRPHHDTPLLSVQELKDEWLVGLDLTDNDGNEFPESLYEKAILAAQDWLEMEVGGLNLREETITDEVHDYYANDYMSFNFLKLFRFPVTEVTKVSMSFPLATREIEFDPSWFRIDSTPGHINLVPAQGSFSSILLSQGGSYLPLLGSGIGSMPAVFKVSYKAGFPSGKLPHALRELIGLKASIAPLNVAGDLIAGAGIASKSISIDGLSQSMSTTSSSTNAGYGARILIYNKEIKERLRAVRDYYLGIQMSVG